MVRIIDLLRLWFGVSLPVTRKAYAASGFALMALKYAVEAEAIRVATGEAFWPWDFLNPTLGARTQLLRTAPEWLGWAMFLWTLPFLWIAVTMSVRRAADAGRSPWLGLVVLIPLINLVLMLSLCLAPSVEQKSWQPEGRTLQDRTQIFSPERMPPERTSQALTPAERALEGHNRNRIRSATFAIGLSQLIGGLMLWGSVYLFSSYGASLFLGTPLLMGAAAGYLHNRGQSRSGFSSAGVGTLAVLFGMCSLLLFALEGFVCIAMAAPLLLPLGAFGGLIGKAIADATQRPQHEFVAAIIALPLLAGGEALLMRAPETMVLSSVEIDAPPEKVWQNVVSFPELPRERAWYFRAGIACPERARIEGSGVGATRYCEFSTGAFVEPITVWDAPRRLAFDVSEQPDPLVELSPYGDLHPPHLHGTLRSTHGEFRLIELPGNSLVSKRTRLEGRTWYKIEMYPHWYWTLWSNALIHRIHERVLMHVKGISEG